MPRPRPPAEQSCDEPRNASVVVVILIVVVATAAVPLFD